MRIAYITADPGVPVFGTKGCSIHVQEVLSALRKYDVSIELFAQRIEPNPPPDLADIKIHRLPVIEKGEVAIRERSALKANEVLLAMLDKAGRFDAVYERYSLWSYAGMEYAKRKSIPGILEVNAPLIDEQAKYRDLVNRREAETVAARAFRAAKVLIAVSQEVASYVKQYVPGTHQVHTVTNAVDPKRFSNATPSSPAPEGIFTFGFLGTLKPWHGLRTLVEAFVEFHKRHRHSRLLIIGDGPEKEWMTRQLEEQDCLQAAEFAGSVPSQQVPGLLASIDVALAPYSTQEPFYFSPLKIFEYMAAGLPIIAGAVGQVTRIIRDGTNGLLIPPGNTEALVQKMERLYSGNRLRNRLGKQARIAAIEKHTWDAAVRNIFTLADLELMQSFAQETN